MEEKCHYCGAILPKEHNINVDDYKLHKDAYGNSCCARCDEAITWINRALAMYIETGNPLYIHNALNRLQEFVDRLDVTKPQVDAHLVESDKLPEHMNFIRMHDGLREINNPMAKMALAIWAADPKNKGKSPFPEDEEYKRFNPRSDE